MSKTVLVVDDDKGIQKLLTDALEGEGFNVLCDKDGSWALRTFENRDIDFIVMDILIPVMNGFQLTERIRKTAKGHSVPILMISGVYHSANYRSEAIRKYGVVDYFDKPISMDKLFAAMREAMGKDYPRPLPVQAPEPSPEAPPADAKPSRPAPMELPDDGSIEIRGNLRDYSFPAVLGYLYKAKTTGALMLQRDKVKKIVQIENGRPIFVKSNLVSECLGQIMLREKMITQPELEESVKLMKNSRRQQGTVLIEMGCISPHNLVFALEKQLEFKLHDIFGWLEGDFQFKPGDQVESPITTLELSAATMIYDGIKRAFPMESIDAAITELMDLNPAPNPNPELRFQDMNMDDSEAFLLQSLDGMTSLADLIHSTVLPQDKIKRFIYALKSSGMIIFKAGPKGAAVPPPVPMQPPPLPAVPPPVRTAPVPEMPAADREIIDKIIQKLSSIRNRSHFEVLDVDWRADTNEIKRAYISLAKEFHPDRLPSSAPREVRKAAEDLFKLFTLAHDTLVDEKSHAEYLKMFAPPVRRQTQAIGGVSAMLAAEGRYRQGLEYFGRRMYVRAAEIFAEAIGLFEHEAEFHAYLGWSLYLADPDNPASAKKALASLATAIQLNHKLDLAYLFQGYVYKSTGRKDLAEQQFEKAIQCNPDCTEALRELRLISGRK